MVPHGSRIYSRRWLKLHRTSSSKGSNFVELRRKTVKKTSNFVEVRRQIRKKRNISRRDSGKHFWSAGGIRKIIFWRNFRSRAPIKVQVMTIDSIQSSWKSELSSGTFDPGKVRRYFELHQKSKGVNEAPMREHLTYAGEIRKMIQNLGMHVEIS